MSQNPTPELSACIGTAADFDGADLSAFDAVYLGQPYCLLREGNLIVDTEALTAAIKALKSEGKRAYLSTPVVPTTDELDVVRSAIEAAAAAGVDGVEAHDMGVLTLLRTDFPRLPLHVGHFANIYHVQTAKVFAGMGASRIMPSYELTLEEKTSFVEAFVTPAVASGPSSSDEVEICVPVAGKIPVGMAHACLLRLDQATWVEGPCHQQCADRRELSFASGEWRMRSAGTAMLMAEDLSMLSHLHTLRQLGFKALRMETWMESPEKISALGKLYSQALDASEQSPESAEKQAAQAAESALAEAGLCNGWYFGSSGREFVDEVEKAYASEELVFQQEAGR